MDVTSTTASAVGQTNNIRAELILNDNRKTPITMVDASGQSNENINIVITINRDTALSGTVVRPPTPKKRILSVQSAEDLSLLEKEQESLAIAELAACQRVLSIPSSSVLSKIAPTFLPTVVFLEAEATPKIPEGKPRAVPQARAQPTTTSAPISDDFQSLGGKDSMNNAKKCDFGQSRKLAVITSQCSLARMAPRECPTVAYICGQDVKVVKPEVEETVLVQRTVAVATTADLTMTDMQKWKVSKDEFLTVQRVFNKCFRFFGAAASEFAADKNKMSFNDVAKCESSRCYPLLPNIKAAVKVPRATVAFTAETIAATIDEVLTQKSPIAVSEPPECPDVALDLYTRNLESMNDVQQKESDEQQNRCRPVRARFPENALFTVDKTSPDEIGGFFTAIDQKNIVGGGPTENRTAVEIATKGATSTLTKVRVDTVTTTTTSTTVTVANTTGFDDRNEHISSNVKSSYKQNVFEDAKQVRSSPKTKGVKLSSGSITTRKKTRSQKSNKDNQLKQKASKSNESFGSATTEKAASADPVDAIGLDIPSILTDEPPPVDKVEQSPVEAEKKPVLSPETHRVVKVADSRKRKTLFTTLSEPSRIKDPPAAAKTAVGTAKTAVGRSRQAIASKSTISALVEETNVGSNAVENRAEIEISNIAPGTKVAVDMEAKQAAPDNECSTSFFMSSAKEAQKTETKSAVLKDRKAEKSGQKEKPKKKSKREKAKKSVKKKKKN
uniref:Uncharacterized protein n=1 Tax=Romanomermis culicivorax TaxID=13658 RepID=A0A915JTE3_ROMCU